MSDNEERLKNMALQLNAEMPTEIWLKGDGSIWITTHGNQGLSPRMVTKEELIYFVQKGINAGNRMISV